MPIKKSSANVKQQSLLARFKLSTKKSKLVASVMAFVVIGGGVMVFRSFAATSGGVYYEYRINSAFFRTEYGAVLQDVPDGKSTVSVINFPTKGAHAYNSESENQPPSNQQYLFCINYIAASGAAKLGFTNQTKVFDLPQASQYTRSCVEGVKVDNTANWAWSLQNLTSNPVSVNRITLEKMATEPTTPGTTAVHTVSASAGNASCAAAPPHGTVTYTSAGCSVVTDSAGAKVYQMTTSGSVLQGKNFNIQNKGQYRTCALAKSTGGSSTFLLSPSGGDVVYHKVPAGTTYSKYCAGAIDVVVPNQSWSLSAAHYGGDGGSALQISSMFLEPVGSTTTPAPTPPPVK
ncbi:hypothetical protein EKI60_01050 [Candidatus Saccharibacteria bacterium]|nr:MAG: hypothetical protein EKI60_01050 [Candidatus Saccharibacteria bacterium]